MYFTDRGLEELVERRGEEQVTLAWLADQMQAFVDQNPDFEVPVERLAPDARVRQHRPEPLVGEVGDRADRRLGAQQ